jgi:7,8-dihydropterin-6-yl-methyl-4-(beta-D-ribofuranosyl)aminobenzene 5'-phosphate synthase
MDSDDSEDIPTVNLEVVDSLEAIVIIDNELDPLSPAAPDTVQVTGNLGTIAMKSRHTLTDRGEACKEVRLEDVCCAAHGLSILVVSYLTLKWIWTRSKHLIDSHERR